MSQLLMDEEEKKPTQAPGQKQESKRELAEGFWGGWGGAGERVKHSSRMWKQEKQEPGKKRGGRTIEQQEGEGVSD